MKICVYTTLLGGYDALLEQDVAATSDADFICFTDDPDLRSETWRVEVVSPQYPHDLHRSSRVYKILGHELLQHYDATLCIDASVRLRVAPERIIDDWLEGDVEMAIAAHSFRETVLAEFDEVIRLNYDDRFRVYEQLTDYAVSYPEVLDMRPRWGGMIVRRQSGRVERAMRTWFDHVLRYSRRDQLSLLVGLQQEGVNLRTLEIDNFDSAYHEWPVIGSRKIEQGKAVALPSGPLVADLRRARARIEQLEGQLETLDVNTVNALRHRVEQLSNEISQGVAERITLESRVEALQRQVWEKEIEMERSAGISSSARAFAKAVKSRLKPGARRPSN
jgi:hypothetical protein